LAQKIKPHIEPGITLCDAGCGLGRLDLELAPYVKELTAIDASAHVIDVLRCDAEKLGLDNLHAEVGDADTLTKTFDIVLLSFFGQENLAHFLNICRHKLIHIVNEDNTSGLYPERYRGTKATVPVVCMHLDAQGIRYKLERYSFEFGQPLRSWQDAELYILKNASAATAEEVRNFLNENITHTGRDDFPFYLPSQKNLGIFIINTEK
jgi:SAM-dependent methyltransferase